MSAYNTLFPSDILFGATRRLVTATAVEPADAGNVGRLARWDYPLLEFSIALWLEAAEEVENLFFVMNGPAGSFLIESPLERDTVFTAQPLVDDDGNPALGTGSAAEFQLASWKHVYGPDNSLVASAFRPIMHVDPATLKIYADEVEIANTLGDLGRVISTAANGAELTADFHARYAMAFVEDQLETTLEAKQVERVQRITIRETIGE